MREKPGAHPHKALSARTVQGASEPGRYADGGGLYLLVAPGGSKSWMLRTIVHGRRRDIGLGSASLVTLAEAREQAHALRKIARAGGDPLAARRLERRTVPSFEEAAQQVHKEQARSFRNEKHQKQWIASLARVIAAIGNRRVDAIVAGDIVTVLSRDWLSKPETSRRVLQRVRLIFDWCKAHGYRDGDNPTEGVKNVLPKQPTVKGHHAALPYRDVPKFIRALRKSPSGENVKLALELLILGALRTSEVINAKRSEINFTTKTWTIPAGRMKAGVEHRVPLTPRMLAILREAQALSGENDLIFTGAKEGQALSNMALLMAVRRLGYDITSHGFRSSFRDWAAERTNFPREVCEAALAHTIKDKTEAAYNRTDLFQRRRRLMNAWSTFAAASSSN